MFFNQSWMETIVTSRYRRVSSEYNLTRNSWRRIIEIQAFIIHTAGDSFKQRKSTVPLVQMQHAGSNSHGSQCAEAAHAEHQFLTYACTAVSTIESRSDLTVFRSVALHVG